MGVAISDRLPGRWVKKDLSSGCLGRTNPYNNLQVAQRVVREGEYQFNMDSLREGSSWIRQNPGRFLVLTARRVRYFWFPAVESDEGLSPLCQFPVLIWPA